MLLSLKDQTVFYRRLSFLLRAGIPIIQAVNILVPETDGYCFRRSLGVIIRALQNGQYFSDVLTAAIQQLQVKR